jgi:hypothetical protein
MILGLLSFKQVTAFPSATLFLNGTGGNPLFGFGNIDETDNSILVKASSSCNWVQGYDCTTFGAKAGDALRGTYSVTAFGAYALDSVTWEYGGTAFGAKAGKGYKGIECTFMGQSAGEQATGNYIIGIGQNAANYAINATYGIHIGKNAGQGSNGASNIFIGPIAGQSTTIANCLIITPTASANNFLYGIHDNASTTGYLNLRGDFNPSTADTYDHGTDILAWNKTFANEVKAKTKFGLGLAPVAPQAHLADFAGDGSTAVNGILDILEAFGLMLPAA